MKFIIKCIKSLNKFERYLWFFSCLAILILYLMMTTKDYITIFTTLLGATSLIFISKGNMLGPIISILFSAFYFVASIRNNYYGEASICILLNIPMCIIGCVSWFKNRLSDNNTEVEVNNINKKEYPLILIMGIVVMVLFYFILKSLNTDALLFSTISILTSFVASYLSIKRSPLYAVAYGLNDIVLIILWSIASYNSIINLCMVLCFVIFLINDIYGFINWQKLKANQDKIKNNLN